MNKEKLRILRNKILGLSAKIDEKMCQQFGFHLREVSLEKITNYLYTPKDSSSLAVTRILFGITMLLDISSERGGATMELRWGKPEICHFPLLPFIRAMTMPYMALVYAALLVGAAGITLGYKYRISAITFTLCYWYLFLVEKSFWNNHSYLFGLIATLLTFTDANCYWSIDAARDPSVKKTAVPYWNYFILKYQFFILYFMAGVKKGTAEWLTGYSVQNLSEHWVFHPFKLFLTVSQTDYLVVHWFVFIFDLTVAFWMMWGRTRHLAMFFCALFHLMNSRLFSIGMFPWVCLATMPLFYPFDWPKIVENTVKTFCNNLKNGTCIYEYIHSILNVTLNAQNVDKNGDKTKQTAKSNLSEIVNEDLASQNPNPIDNVDVNEEDAKNDLDEARQIDEDTAATSYINTAENTDNSETSATTDDVEEPSSAKDKYSKLITVLLIFFHVLTQAFLPFSHFLTQGYNNWTEGLYGYSWDMMVHTWDTNSVVIKIVDNERSSDFYIDPYLYAPNDRWTRHGDMLHQYVHCIKDNLIAQSNKYGGPLSNNLSVYADVWCSMNGRFTQRMFDPKQDLVIASWSPFEPMSYLMPLLDDALSWRNKLQDMREEVYSWDNGSDVIFIADFPGYDQEKYIPTDLSNVTLTILQGKILFDPELTELLDGYSYQLTTGQQMKVDNGKLHKVLNVGETPAYYMYTFVNTSVVHDLSEPNATKLPIVRELVRQFYNMLIFIYILVKNILEVLVECVQCRCI